MKIADKNKNLITALYCRLSLEDDLQGESNSIIRRVEVFEKPEKYSRKIGNLIKIYYTFQLPEQDGMPDIMSVYKANLKKSA